MDIFCTVGYGLPAVIMLGGICDKKFIAYDWFSLRMAEGLRYQDSSESGVIFSLNSIPKIFLNFSSDIPQIMHYCMAPDILYDPFWQT